MKFELGHIASVQTGIFAKPTEKGEITYLQVKHFNEGGLLIGSLHPDLNAGGISEKHLLRRGDVLFAAKGTKNFAAFWDGGALSAVASTSFFVIRLYDESVLPQYLTWFLNHPNTQLFLKRRAKGTAIVSISKSALGDLEIPVPAIETQQAILKIASLGKLEARLKKQLGELQDQYIQTLLIKSAQQ